MDRRGFLKRTVKSFFILLGLSFIPSVLYVYPSNIKLKTIKFIYALDEEELPHAGVKRVDLSYEREGRKANAKAFIAASNEGLIALSPVCSHLGCLVNWDTNRSEFLCPCHGGRYDMEGRITGGPPPAPLSRLPLEVKGGKVYIGIKI